MKVDLGSVYRDTISGFVGTATARTEYQFDTPSVRLEPFTGANGSRVESYFSEARLEPHKPLEVGMRALPLDPTGEIWKD